MNSFCSQEFCDANIGNPFVFMARAVCVPEAGVYMFSPMCSSLYAVAKFC